MDEKKASLIESIRDSVAKLEEIMPDLARDAQMLRQKLNDKCLVEPEFAEDIIGRIQRLTALTKLCRVEYGELCQRPLPEKLEELSRSLREQELTGEELRLKAAEFLRLNAQNTLVKNILLSVQADLCVMMIDEAAKPEDFDPYIDFMEAMAAKDEVAITYVPRLLAKFDPRLVAHALMEKQVTCEKMPDIGAAAELPSAETKTALISAVRSIGDRAAAAMEDPTKKVKAPAKPAPKKSRQPGKLLASKHFSLLTEEAYGEFTYLQSPREIKDFKPSKFVKEVLNVPPYVGEKKMTLRFLYVLEAVSPEFMYALTERPLENWQIAMNFLQNKGYLRKYALAGLGEFFGASPRFLDVMASQSAATALSVNRQKKRDDYMVVEPDARFLPSRLAYLQILTALIAQRRGAKENAASSMAGLDLARKFLPGAPYVIDDSFFYHRTEKDQGDFIIGCFWYDAEEAGEFLEELEDFYPKIGSLKRVIIAVLNKEQAMPAYEVIAATVGEKPVDKGELYFYVLAEHKFYAGTEQSEISPAEIWGEPEAAETDIDNESTEESADESVKPDSPTETENLVVAEPKAQNKKVASRDKLTASTAQTPPTATKATAPAAAEDKERVVKKTDKAKKAEEPSEIAEKSAKESAKAKTAATAPVKAAAPEPVKTPELALNGAVSAPIASREFTPEGQAEALDTAAQMVTDKKIYCATAYLKACSLFCPEMETDYLRLAYAVNDPLTKCVYSSDKIYELFGGADTAWDEHLMTAASLRTFMLDSAGFDYGMPMLHDALKQCMVVDEVAPLADLLYMMMEFKQTAHKGVDHYADYRVKSRMQLERQMETIRREAKDTYSNYIEGNIKEKAKQRRFIETKKLLFDRNNYLATFLTAVINNDLDSLSLIRDYLFDTFMRDESVLDKENIDAAKMNKLIDDTWWEAGEHILRVRKNMDLMGSLRNNLASGITKIVEILCQWVVCAELLAGETDDDGRILYKKKRGALLKTTEQAMDELMARVKSAQTIGERAGLRLVVRCLSEIQSRLSGTFVDDRGRYFYVDFLRGPYVLLDDDYHPDFTRNFDADSRVSVMERIKAHAAADLMSLEDRVRYALEGGGDDFRSARMIDACLVERMNSSVIETAGYDVNTSIEYARTDMEKIKDEFIENLELAQSYGQIDNLQENKKEKILQIINYWYDYAQDTTDFGVFKRVKEYWEAKIREDAKTRAAGLRQEIDACCANMPHTAEFKERLAKIEQMIGQQNYTVAEDMLHRLGRNEPEVDGTIFDDDNLQIFLNNYEVYYAKVSRNAYSLTKLLGNRQRNKDERGGARLAENWIVNGSRTGAAKMEKLLETLGFAVEKVTELPNSSAKIEGYNVGLRQPLNGQKANYKHPIAAFGSTAETAGFRVVCLFGKYDADGLIERFKELGNAKHTIVMLDYSLPLSDRRRLARKVRAELFEKVFAVVDRVLLMYLISNYNEMRVNQMLMALMMPFAYYQPYVWESSKVMPPEIFMGRKEELAKIESAEGVNIVYGGRQLGKSAMLKMAKNDIDRNENNDRAILVDIKDKNSAETALKISQALNDEDFFDAPETDNWDDLARAIKKRLNSKEAPYIPYFLLLLDEADAFIESCAADNYRAFDALKDIQSVGVGRFKFVIAGLRNIIRFNRQTALGNNNVVTHLASMTVKPFRTNEARELLEVPLFYLGLRFPQGKESLISLILASTNYFPGLIQLYCAKLIEAMTKSDYAGYNQGETPIYEIREDHIKKVLADPGFTDQIREKFEITLKLGDDQNYYIIALLFAYLYHENGAGGTDGYGVDDLWAKADSLGLEQISGLSAETIAALLEDLRELNILRATTSDKYLFTRYAFFQMMGNQTEVEEKLLTAMEEGA